MFERNIRDWYHGAYENDSIYLDINPDGTFQHVIDALLSNNPGDNVYLWTADDTVVRERVFMELSEMLGTDYDLFYNCWLDDPEAKKKLASLIGRSAKKNKAEKPKKTIPAPKPPVKPVPKEKPKAEKPKVEKPKRVAPAPKPEKPKVEKPKKEVPKKAISRPVKKVDPTKVAQIFEVRVGTEVKGQFTSKLKAEALKRDLKKNGMKPKVVVIHR